MICPKCKELNQKSMVRPGWGSVTSMYCPPYYDEDGKYHHHDMNIHRYSYSCSQGHSLIVVPSSKCPSCDFGEEEKITIKEYVKDTPTLDGSLLVANGTNTVTLENSVQTNATISAKE